MKRGRRAHAGNQHAIPKGATRAADQSSVATTASVEHPVLSRLYPDVLSLRHYLLSRLPASSRAKARRRKLSQLGLLEHPGHGDTAPPARSLDLELAELLDTTLVGVLPGASRRDDAERQMSRDLDSFSQEISATNPSAGTFKHGYLLQAEVSQFDVGDARGPMTGYPERLREGTVADKVQIVDFVIWRLFKRSTSYRPAHLLCHGFQRSSGNGRHVPQKTAHSIPGVSSCYRNTNVEALKGPLWCRLHAHLGKDAALIMMDLLSDCGIFMPVKKSEGNGNLLQLSGLPISDLKPAHALERAPAAPPAAFPSKRLNSLASEDRQPNAIAFVRNRMLYARAALNAKGGVRFGMRHIREKPPTTCYE